MKYVDSGSRDPADTLYTWLEQVLPDAVYFGCQTGYFAYDGIFPLEAHFANLLQRQDGELRLVVGANESGIRRVDLEDVLDLFDTVQGNRAKSLVLVAANDVLMHPKTFYVEKTDGSRHVFIGSANLTHSGLGRNIEAALVADSDNDPSVPFQDVRTAIDKWHLVPNTNAHLVSRASLSQLVADGVLDQTRPPRSAQSPKSHQNRAKVFPGLGSILKLPRKKRLVAPKVPVKRTKSTSQVPIGTLGTLPNGSVGVIKRLTALDTKGFNGQSGTLYIALPSVVAPYLPMTPQGVNSEPRVDVSVEARIDTVLGEIVRSGSSTTNITHVGAGSPATSHTDLRFNFLTPIKRGIQNVASAHGVPAPAADDLVAIEFLAGVQVRVTFVTEPSAIASLTPLLDQPGNKWGWLPPMVIAPWEGDDDA